MPDYPQALSVQQYNQYPVSQYSKGTSIYHNQQQVNGGGADGGGEGAAVHTRTSAAVAFTVTDAPTPNSAVLCGNYTRSDSLLLRLPFIQMQEGIEIIKGRGDGRTYGTGGEEMNDNKTVSIIGIGPCLRKGRSKHCDRPLGSSNVHRNVGTSGQ